MTSNILWKNKKMVLFKLSNDANLHMNTIWSQSLTKFLISTVSTNVDVARFLLRSEYLPSECS